MEQRGKDTKDFVTYNRKMQKISPIKERILKFADTLDISRREFYKKTGISRGTLESSTGITEDTLAKFIAAFGELSPEWILTGNGEMYRHTHTSCFTKAWKSGQRYKRFQYERYKFY